MSSTANFIVSGVLADGTPIVFGAVPSDGTSHPAIHHVSSASQFQAESWDGEHAEHDHHEHEEPRRFSIYLEEGGAEKSGLNQDDDVLEDEPIASSGQFERTRSASLAAALLELDPRGVPLVQFFKLATNEPLLEVDEGEDEVAPTEAELVLSQLLFTLRSLKMSGGDAKHSEAVQRLRELEEELRAAGAVTPADPAVSEAVARALAVAGAGRDVQIRVNQSKHTTTTKTVYDTETSAMAHMDVDQIRKLQQDIIADISSGAEQHSGQDSGTTQKKETAEEGFTNEDGSVVVSKKMTRVVTTTRTTLPGEGEEPSAPDSPVESLGSVKDRIAKFEQFKTLPIDPSVSGPPSSVHALPAEELEEEEEQAPVPAVREHLYEQREAPESPEHPHVTENTTTTTVTREFQESPSAEIEHRALESPEHPHITETTTTTTVTREFHESEPTQEHQKESYTVHEHPAQPEFGEESDGEGIGSKVLGFAKKAGMVAGGVVAAPVALAAVGAKAAYDALKKDSDEEGEDQEQKSPIHEHQEASFSPAPSSHAESEQRQVPESPALSEKEHIAETTTTRDFHDEPTSEGRDSGRSGHTEQSIPEVHFTESDTEIEKHDEHHEETFLEPTVGIVITPHTPVPPEHPEEEVEDEQPQEPLELSEPEHVAHAEIKDTREYSDEELSHELSPSEEHVSTAEIKDIKSYSPTSSDDERKGKVSPPLPQVRHVISPSVASEISSHDDELAAHFVAESFEKHDEGRVETIEQTPIYRGHHSPGQTSPIVSEHPIAQEYAESVTSHDEGDNISLKSGHEPEIARHSVASVQEEEDDEKSGLGDYAKKAGMIVGGVIAAPVALAAVGAKAAYDALKRDSGDEEEMPEGHEEKEVLTTQTTIMESPIQHEDIPPPHLEDVTPKVSHHEQPLEPSESPVPSEKEPEHHLVSETTTTTTVTREFYDEQEQHPEAHIESERQLAESPVASEKEYPAGVVETTTTTTYVTRQCEEEPEVESRRSPSPAESQEHPVTRDYEQDQESESPESVREVPHVTETTTTTTVTRGYDQPEEGFDSERLSEPSTSPEPQVVETTSTTTVTREFHEEPEHGSPIPSDRSARSSRHSPVPSEPISEKDAHHVTETTTTTTVTREFYEQEEPEASPIHAEHQFEQEKQMESPVPSEKSEQDDVHLVKETTTTTTVTREYDEEPEAEATYEFKDDEYPRPESPAEVYPIQSVSETTTTTTVTREFYDEPEEPESKHHPAESPKKEHPHVVESREFHEDFERPESPSSEGEHRALEPPQHPHVTETTTTTTVTREFYDDDSHIEHKTPESPVVQERHERFHAESSHQPESGDESDGEGIGSKVLGFAKKAGMVAGGVVAAPVALAAVGAKAAYDALKKDSDEEEEQKSPIREQREASFSADISAESEHRQIPESPAVSEKPEIDADEPSDLTKDSPIPEPEHHIVTETTTTVIREIFDEPQHEEEAQLESERQESPVEEHPHIVETTTTRTVTREYEEEPDILEKNYEEPEESHEHLVKETIATTTVTREFFDEPEKEHQEESYSPAPSSHIESEHHRAESPVGSEKEHPHHVVETTTTTTVTREFHDEEHDAQFDIERDVPFSEVEHRDLESPEVTETTVTTTVTREYDEEASHHPESPKEFDRAVEKSEPHAESRQYSPSGSPVPSEKSTGHVMETTATTTVTREYEQPEEEFESERLSEPSKSPEPEPHAVETTTTTTVTREFQEESEHFEQHGSPIQAESPRHSPVPSEPMSEKEAHHVTETTTTTTVTREFYEKEEPEHREASPQQFEQRESPVPSEKSDVHLVKETTTTTTVTSEFYDEPEQTQEHPEESYSPAPSSNVESERHLAESPVASEKEYPAGVVETTTTTRQHEGEPEVESRRSPLSNVESEHYQVPESPAVYEKQFTTETSMAQESAAAQYFHEQPEQAPKQPESGDESDGEGLGSKVLGFAKKAGMVAGGVVAAPVALAAVGAKAAYDALKKDSEGEDEEDHETLLREQRSQQYQQFDESEHKFEESPEKHHVTETTTTTTVTREYFDEPESPAPSHEGQESEPHVVETTTTTTVKRDYDEEPTSESPIPPETTSTREVFETAEGDEPEHHYIETTTTTVQKEVLEEPEEAEIPHVVETTTTTKTTREYEDDEEGSESGSGAPHVTETTTTTTVVREFYGDQSEDQEPVAAKVEEQDVSPDSESTTSVSREIHADEPHVVETTTTTTVTREYHDEPEEDSDAKETTTRDYYEEEPESPVKHSETTTTTTISRDIHEEEDPRVERLKSPLGQEHDDLQRSESPVHLEPHVTETTTTTTATREYDQPEDQFDSERLSESSEQAHVVETTTTTTVTREYDEEESEHFEEHGSPIPSERSVPQAESPRQSSIPSEHEESHLVKETTTTTTVTREFYDEPEHPSPVPSEKEQEHHLVTETTTTTTVTREYEEEPEHVHAESDHPESPAVSEKPFTTEAQMTQDSPAAQYFHEQSEISPPTEQAPLLSQKQHGSGDESDGEGFGSKVPGFAKKAGMIAGGVVAAPVALAAVGAKAAYDALKKDSDEEGEEEQEALLGAERSEGYQRFDEPEQRFQEAQEPSEFHPESPIKSHPTQEEDQESLKSPTESRHVVETTTTTTYEQDSTPASPAHSHKEDLKQFQDEESPESSRTSSDKEEEKEPDTSKPDVESQSQGSYSPGYSPKSPRGSLAASDDESRPVVEAAEEHDDIEVKATGSPVPSEGSTKFMETTTTTTVTREHVEPEDEPERVVESQEYTAPGSPEPVDRVIETTTTTTVTREHQEPEDQFEHPSEPQEYRSESPESSRVIDTTTTEQFQPEENEPSHVVESGSPVPSEKSVGHVIETTTTTTVTREYEHPEEEFDSERVSEPSKSPEPHVTTTTTVTREFHEEPEHGSPIPSERSVPQAESPRHSPVPSEPMSEKDAHHVTETTTTTTVTREFYEQEEPEHREEEGQQRESPIHQQFEDYQHQYSEEPAIAPYQQPTEYGRVDSHDAPASPAPSVESPAPQQQGFDSERVSEPHHEHIVDSQQYSPTHEPEQHHFTEAQLAHDSPAAQYFHEQPEHPTEQAPQQPESGDESDGEGLGSKVLGFAKKAGMVAGGVVAAPVALAAVGAKAAYDALKKDSDEEGEEEQEAVLGAERSKGYQPEQRFQESPTHELQAESHPTEPASDDESPASDVEPEHLSRKVSESEQTHHYTETIRKTTVTREYLDDDETAPQESQDPSEQVVETTTTVIRQYHDEPKPEEESEEKTLPEEVTVLREVYEAPAGDEPEHHYIETKTTTTITKEVYEPKDSDVPASPIEEPEPHSGDTTITKVTREVYEEPEGVRPPSGSEADDESHAPRYLETTTTTTVTREYEVSEDEEDARQGSPAPSEESVTRVVEKTTTTTVTEERYEPEEEHDDNYIKTTTTTTTVTREQFDEPESVVESQEYRAGSPDQLEHPSEPQEYRSGSPVPSEQESSRVIETTTTTTVTREHVEPEEYETSHIVDSQQYSPSTEPDFTDAQMAHDSPAESPAPLQQEFESERISEPSRSPVQEPHHDQFQQRTSEESHFTEAQMAHDSPAAQYFHEQPEYPTEQAPLLSQPQESGDESDGEGFGSKVLGFAKKAGMVAGGVVAAPVALAAVGAKAAYDALKKDSDEEGEEEQEALLGEQRSEGYQRFDEPAHEFQSESPIKSHPSEPAVDSETQEPGATFYEPEEEDKVPVSSPKEEEPKIVFPVDTPADAYVQEKQAFESAVQAEGLYIIESDDYEPSVHQEQRISSPVHSDSEEAHQAEPEEEEETPRAAENLETDAPYVIDSEEYEFNNREEQRISSPADSDVEPEEDPTVVESEEYTGSGQGSPRPFEESTTTTVISVHHEPAAIPEPEVDEEEELEQVQPSEEHLEARQDPYIVDSEEYIRSSPIGHERPESPSGSPVPQQDEDHVIESQEYTGSPVPSEESIQHVVEKVTTTTTTEEHFEPEDSSEDVQEYVKTTTTTTTVTQEDFEPIVESQEYKSGSPIPSEPESARVIETTTTTTVTREHIEPEDEPGSPVPESPIETKTTTTVTREHVEPEDEPEHVAESQEYSAPGSPESVDRVIETITTTTVTREHVEHEDDFGPVHTEAESGSPVPSEEDVHGFIKTTTTTTTVTREHFEPEDEPEHVVESQEYSAPGSPESVDRVIETITTTTVTREHVEHEDDFGPVHTEPEPEEDVHGFIKTTTTTTTVTREHFEPEDEPEHVVESQQYSPSGSPVIESSEQFEPEDRRRSPVPSEGEVHESIKTTSAMTSESHYEPEQHESESPPTEQAPLLSQPQESGDESDGEGFGSKVLGFAKKAGIVAGGVVAAPVALAAVGAKAAYDALKKDSDEEGEEEQEALLGEQRSEGYQRFDEPEQRFQESPTSAEEEKYHHESAELQRPAPTIETREESDSDGSFVDHGEDSQHLPPQSTEAAFKLSTEDVAEQTAEKLVSEVFSPLDRTLKESEQYRASIESLNRRSPVESKKSVEDLASEALENVTKISFGHADEAEDKHDDEEEWKVYDRHGEILEEFSTQLTDDVIQEAEGDATTQIMTMTQAEYSPRRSKFLKQESCQETSNEPEVDYYSDLQEKLNILAGEKNNLHALIEEEPSSSASDQLDVIHESDQEAHLEQEHQPEAAAQKEQEEKEEAAEYTATVLVDEVLQQVVHEIIEEEDDQKTMTSDAYLTATEKDDQEYDTCVTSQDDTYESAQGWTSQDSEYTTATSQAPSRLSDSDGEHTARDLERQETSTPQAMVSPVDSDRQFTAQQDFEMPVIKAFDADDFMQTTARSTPDVALQVTIEEEDESDDKLPISPSGILLPPKHDPGRPISPVPPRKTDATMQKEGDHFVFVREEDTIAEPTPPPQQFHPETEEEVRRTPDDTLTTVPPPEEETEMRRQETERIHSLAMEASSDLGNSESSRYSRQLSDLSSSAESHADTVIRVESERSGSSDSLEVVSVISAGKDARTSEKSSTPEEKSPVEEKPDKEAEDLGFEVYDADTEEQQQQQQPIEELETVEEEPEDSDSLNEGGNHSSGHSSVGVPADTLAMIGKYRHQSSDNLSLTSLQEFERLEREVGARGDGSLTRSEIELLVAGRLNKSGEGSVSSLAEFERLEKEMTENQSPPEDVMMLSDIREESEAEDMSTRGDDDEDMGGSDTELKSRPVQDEDLRVVTPIAPSPTDSLEHAIDPVQMQYLETSTDSLEPTFQEIEVEQRPDSVEDTSLTEYEMVPRVMEASTTDSLDGTATIEKDSLLEGASQGIESTQSTHGLLSGDTLGTVVTDDDRDSLDGEVSSMLQSYPTTLTTFQTTVVGPDGSLQTISRRVETRVTDPLVSHVTFTGTESQERLDQLPDDEQFETVDTEGNVTRTTFHREHDQQHSHY